MYRCQKGAQPALLSEKHAAYPGCDIVSPQHLQDLRPALMNFAQIAVDRPGACVVDT